MRGISDKAWAAGWNVVRLNQRNCGNTEHLSRGLYHSGLTHDPLFVMRELIERDGIRVDRDRRLFARRQPGAEAGRRTRRVGAAGAGGGLRRLADAWTWRAASTRSSGDRTSSISGISCGTSRRGCGGRRRRFPGAYSLEPLRRVWTVRGFDEAYTAPHHGFRDAADYYHRASALRVVDRIRVPTLIITAEDDPFVPDAPFRGPDGRRQSEHHARHHAARRPLRLSGAAGGGLRRLLGRAGDHAVCAASARHAISMPRELRPLPGFFVLEVDEDVAALRRPLLDHARPPFDVRRAIPLVP